ncbi:right-handed parallel beta-helix repeat-containing protein [Sandaracinobacteroides saxicola]|uniref:Right-handed parallel beta-helix repeat-containing protein n=1 Tax=Sandaracinobacteroides saxicola TaxID=2759707 RepID=A0A7G5IG62_9SPHN|nr:right-handed parallel beta-helix repeat-containing protein [Sandaracinobacteroides saxicola]QMW22354.1 right-handed parallel beta-helix repeat-containing protein [Sandaracinobacteroides saxicola]
MISFLIRRVAPVIPAVLLSVSVQAQSIPVFNASSSAELVALLKTITQPADIALAPGNYGVLNLQSINPPADVRIRSASSSRAVFTDMFVRNSSRLRFHAIDVSHALQPGEGQTAAAVFVRDSSDIRFTSCNFYGTRNDDPNDDGMHVRVMNSARILLMGNSFSEARIAFFSDGAQDMLLVSNSFSVVREAVNLQAARDVVFDRNLFREIRPNLALGDHSDSIQVYAGAVPVASTGLTFTNNAMILNNWQAQGIFIRNETGNPAYNHGSINISNNLYFGAMRNGISVADSKSITVSKNTLVSSPDFTHEPAILLRNSTSISLSRNIMPLLYLENATPTQSANIDLADSIYPTGAETAAQFTGNVAMLNPAINSFRVRAGSEAALALAGFTPTSEIGSVAASVIETRYGAALSRLATMARNGGEYDE